MRWSVFLPVSACFVISSTLSAGEIDFARDVQPILSQNCYACHGPDEEQRSADLRLDTEEGARAALTVGDPASSEMIHRIMSDDPDDLMPPPEKKDRLSPAQVEILTTWIKEGAAWGKHWSFEKPVRPEVPENGSNAVIDAFVKARLEVEAVEFSPVANRETLLRRASLDLTGLPPTIAQLDAILADQSPDAFATAVDALLKSKHYGERWARWWMDAARYADSNGYEKDSVRFVWPYRDWLIDAFNENLSYDEFIIKQVGGDMLENATLDDRVATGFLRNAMVNEEGAIDAEQFRVEGIFDRMDAIGKSVLGLTTQCAQCHTHKYDPITHDEYFGMFAYLNRSHEATVPYHTPAVRGQIKTLFSKIEQERELALEGIPNWESGFAQWIAAEKAKLAAAPDWVTVTPRHLGDGGQKFYAQADGSIITQGYSPARSTERFAGETKLTRISSLRLELLTDPYLTYGGPGRSIEGTVAISELKLSAGVSADALKPVAFKPAVSDLDLPARAIDGEKYPQKNGGKEDRTEGPAAFINDGNVKTAWATEAGWARSNQPRVVVMDLKEPITLAEGETLHLQFEVACQHGGWNSNDNQHRNMGRFRFSFAAASAGDSAPLSPGLQQAITRPEESWSAGEKDSLVDAWLKTQETAMPQLAEIEKLHAAHPAPIPQLVLQEQKDPRETRLYHRGEQHQPKHVVTPHVPAFIHDLPEGRDPESRLTFAQWLVDPDSPTTARTFVNRTWSAFFGNGIVESVEDLGHQSPRPSHPELLDWLAVEFMESGWDIKHLHRLIVLSDTYQQSSTMGRSLDEMDPQNRLLARGARFRPDAEVVRDIQLAASGLLDRTVGGDSVRPPIPRFLFDPPASYGYKEWDEDSAPERRYRRALYTFRFRTVVPPFLSAFDAPSGEVSCVRRPRSTTPLQALALLNEPMSVEAAEALAVQLKTGEADLSGAIHRAFRQCTSRAPESDELAVLLDLFKNEKDAGADPFLAVARVLLNLDETITKS